MIKRWIDAGMVYAEKARAKMGTEIEQLSPIVDELLNGGPEIGTENTIVEIEHDGNHYSIEHAEGIQLLMINMGDSSIVYDYENQNLWPLFFYMREGDMSYTYHTPLESGFPEEVITVYRDEDKLAEYCFRSFY